MFQQLIIVGTAVLLYSYNTREHENQHALVAGLWASTLLFCLMVPLRKHLSLKWMLLSAGVCFLGVACLLLTVEFEHIKDLRGFTAGPVALFVAASAYAALTTGNVGYAKTRWEIRALAEHIFEVSRKRGFESFAYDETKYTQTKQAVMRSAPWDILKITETQHDLVSMLKSELSGFVKMEIKQIGKMPKLIVKSAPAAAKSNTEQSRENLKYVQFTTPNKKAYFLQLQ